MYVCICHAVTLSRLEALAASGATTSVLSNRLRGGLSQLLALAAVVVVLGIHFGLGTAKRVRELRVRFPKGREVVRTNVETDRIVPVD